MRPMIGIVARVEYPGDTHKLVIEERYRNAILKSGGFVTCIMPSQIVDYTTTKTQDQAELTDEEKELIIKQIDNCDGLLLPGGFKTNKYDRFIVDYAIEKDIPTLGICLGMQIIGNYKNEPIWNEKNASFLDHMGDGGVHHEVTIDKSSKLYSILGNDRISVLSKHNYHILPNERLTVSSVSDDNYIESVEMKDKKFIVGVQWHPEDLDDEYSKKLFNYFIDICK